MFDKAFKLNMDKSTNEILLQLSNNLKTSRTDAIRRSIRLMHKISEIVEDSSEIIIRCSKTKKEKDLILIN
jgi:hypothetical protein